MHYTSTSYSAPTIAFMSESTTVLLGKTNRLLYIQPEKGREREMYSLIACTITESLGEGFNIRRWSQKISLRTEYLQLHKRSVGDEKNTTPSLYVWIQQQAIVLVCVLHNLYPTNYVVDVFTRWEAWLMAASLVKHWPIPTVATVIWEIPTSNQE